MSNPARLAPLAVLLALPGLARGQALTLGGERDRYLRILELGGQARGAPIVFRAPSSLRAASWAGNGHPWSARYPTASPEPAHGRPSLQLVRPEAEALFSSAQARVANDGPLWAGRGVSARLTGGLSVRWRAFTGTLAPVLWLAQNRDYDIAPVPYPNRSPYAYQWHANIDWPQRLGPDAVTELDWGQSGIRVDLGAFTAGFSTENLWWGPGYRNAIIMSNAGAGFPHLDLGTGYPFRTRIGDLEVRALWGALAESAFFDTIPDNGRRFLAGLTIGYRPGFLPGLNLGLTRVLYQPWPSQGLATGDILDVLGEIFRRGTILPSGRIVNDSTDQLASITARWVLPESGFEAYMEWARTDFNEDLEDFLVEPEHSRAYTIGFQKLLPSGEGKLRLAAEHTTLGTSATGQVRGAVTYYVHGIATQGYTHRGQLLGAAIGPGGQSQFIGIDRYTRGGRWGVFVERIRFNDDAYFRIFAVPPGGPAGDFHSHQVELTLGASVFRFAGDADLGASLELSRTLNRYFVQNNDVTNLKLELSAAWGRRETR